jgi:hypothetical protein
MQRFAASVARPVKVTALPLDESLFEFARHAVFGSSRREPRVSCDPVPWQWDFTSSRQTRDESL